MKSKLYLAAALIVSAGTAFADSQQPQYNEMALPSAVSGGYFRGSIVFADINSDGNMDLLLKGRDLNNGWNPDVLAVTCDNSGSFSGSVILPSSSPYESTLAAFDFNNDGHVDYLLNAYGYELYRNNGDGTFTKMENFSLESNLNISDDNGSSECRYMGLTAIADFNMDGYQDIVVMDADGNPVLYKNNGGDGTFTKVADSGLFAQRNGTMAVGDFNNDGCPDLAVSGWSDEVGNDCITINKNNGDGTFTRVTSDVFAGTEKGQIMFVDVDGDGRLDLFVTGQSGTEAWANVAYIYRNNGDETFTKVETSLTGACKSGCDWADVNGDGLMDIIYAGETSNESKAIVAINEGGLVFTQYDNLLCRARGGAAVAAYDINRNGFPNIAIMGYNDNGAPHTHVFNGLCSRNINVAPTPPANLSMTNAAGKVTLTWDAATDSKTPAEALRYNVYVKLTDGSIVTLVPADPQTGALRLGDVSAALTTCSYTLNVDADKIAEWGVQAIDGGKYASAFAKYDATSGICSVGHSGTAIKLEVNGRMINVNTDATVIITDMSGKMLVNTMVAANSAKDTGLDAGVYIVKATAGNGESAVKKFIIK